MYDQHIIEWAQHMIWLGRAHILPLSTYAQAMGAAYA